MNFFLLDSVATIGLTVIIHNLFGCNSDSGDCSDLSCPDALAASV